MLQEIANHLWQSTLFLCCIGTLCFFLRGEDARVRYWLWWVASIKFFVPFSALTAVGGWFSPSASIELVDLTTDWVFTVSSVGQPFTAHIEQQESWSWGTLLLSIWAVGSCLVLCIWAVRANRIRRLIKDAVQEPNTLRDQSRIISVYRTKADIEPGVVGLFRPALLLPQGLENRLSAPKFEAVLAHELCHIRRRDNLTAALHMLVEAVFWFFPLIWWLGFRLIDERERACDEMVVNLGHDRATYAQSILDVCEQYVSTRLACAPGISGSDLKRRIVKIMNYNGAKDMKTTKKLILGTLFFFAPALPIAGGLFFKPGVLAQEVQETRPLSQSTARALEPVRNFLAPQPEEDGSPVPEPDPNAALGEIQNIGIDRLPSHEKAEVYYLYGYIYYRLEDMQQVKSYWQRVIDEPEANLPLVIRTMKSLAQVHMIEEEYEQALDLYLEWMSYQDIISSADYALIGNIYYSLERYDEALNYIERAINMREEIGETGQESWYNLQNNINQLRGNSATVVESHQGELAIGYSVSDSDIIPLMAVQPNYPREAAMQRLEGYCVVSFTITTAGTTTDIQEEECSNSIFMRDSILAAEQLKYRPRIIDGRPVEVQHNYKFSYEYRG